MVYRRHEWTAKNSAVITPTSLHYPLAESLANVDDLGRRDDFPLKNFRVENKSGVNITLIIDPIGGDGELKFIIPDGQTIASNPNDDFTFHNLLVKNDGLLDIPINNIITNVRNY